MALLARFPCAVFARHLDACVVVLQGQARPTAGVLEPLLQTSDLYARTGSRVPAAAYEYAKLACEVVQPLAEAFQSLKTGPRDSSLKSNCAPACQHLLRRASLRCLAKLRPRDRASSRPHDASSPRSALQGSGTWAPALVTALNAATFWGHQFQRPADRWRSSRKEGTGFEARQHQISQAQPGSQA